MSLIKAIKQFVTAPSFESCARLYLTSIPYGAIAGSGLGISHAFYLKYEYKTTLDFQQPKYLNLLVTTTVFASQGFLYGAMFTAFSPIIAIISFAEALK